MGDKKEKKKKIKNEHDHICIKCGTYYENLEDGFYKLKHGKSGYSGDCKDCRRSQARQKYEEKQIKIIKARAGEESNLEKTSYMKSDFIGNIEEKYERLFMENCELKEYIKELEEALQSYKQTIVRVKKEKWVIR